MAQIVIASDLADGRVVFLAKGSTREAVRWGRLIDESAIAEADDAADELLAWAEADAAARHEIVDPYLIEVEQQAGGLLELRGDDQDVLGQIVVGAGARSGGRCRGYSPNRICTCGCPAARTLPGSGPRNTP